MQSKLIQFLVVLDCTSPYHLIPEQEITDFFYQLLNGNLIDIDLYTLIALLPERFALIKFFSFDNKKEKLLVVDVEGLLSMWEYDEMEVRWKTLTQMRLRQSSTTLYSHSIAKIRYLPNQKRFIWWEKVKKVEGDDVNEDFMCECAINVTDQEGIMIGKSIITKRFQNLLHIQASSHFVVETCDRANGLWFVFSCQKNSPTADDEDIIVMYCDVENHWSSQINLSDHLLSSPVTHLHPMIKPSTWKGCRVTSSMYSCPHIDQSHSILYLLLHHPLLKISYLIILGFDHPTGKIRILFLHNLSIQSNTLPISHQVNDLTILYEKAISMKDFVSFVTLSIEDRVLLIHFTYDDSNAPHYGSTHHRGTLRVEQSAVLPMLSHQFTFPKGGNQTDTAHHALKFAHYHHGITANDPPLDEIGSVMSHKPPYLIRGKQHYCRDNSHVTFLDHEYSITKYLYVMEDPIHAQLQGTGHGVFIPLNIIYNGSKIWAMVAKWEQVDANSHPSHEMFWECYQLEYLRHSGTSSNQTAPSNDIDELDVKSPLRVNKISSPVYISSPVSINMDSVAKEVPVFEECLSPENRFRQLYQQKQQLSGHPVRVDITPETKITRDSHGNDFTASSASDESDVIDSFKGRILNSDAEIACLSKGSIGNGDAYTMKFLKNVSKATQSFDSNSEDDLEDDPFGLSVSYDDVKELTDHNSNAGKRSVDLISSKVEISSLEEDSGVRWVHGLNASELLTPSTHRTSKFEADRINLMKTTFEWNHLMSEFPAHRDFIELLKHYADLATIPPKRNSVGLILNRVLSIRPIDGDNRFDVVLGIMSEMLRSSDEQRTRFYRNEHHYPVGGSEEDRIPSPMVNRASMNSHGDQKEDHLSIDRMKSNDLIATSLLYSLGDFEDDDQEDEGVAISRESDQHEKLSIKDQSVSNKSNPSETTKMGLRLEAIEVNPIIAAEHLIEEKESKLSDEWNRQQLVHFILQLSRGQPSLNQEVTSGIQRTLHRDGRSSSSHRIVMQNKLFEFLYRTGHVVETAHLMRQVGRYRALCELSCQLARSCIDPFDGSSLHRMPRTSSQQGSMAPFYLNRHRTNYHQSNRIPFLEASSDMKPKASKPFNLHSDPFIQSARSIHPIPTQNRDSPSDWIWTTTEYDTKVRMAHSVFSLALKAYLEANQFDINTVTKMLHPRHRPPSITEWDQIDHLLAVGCEELPSSRKEELRRQFEDIN